MTDTGSSHRWAGRGVSGGRRVGGCRAEALDGPGPGGRVGALITTAVLTISLWVWVTGQVAARLVRGHWLSMPAADMPRLLLRLPARVRDPRQAWPAGVREELPGPLEMMVIGVVLLVAVAIVTLFAVRMRQRWRGLHGAGGRWSRVSGGAPRRGSARLGRSCRPVGDGARWATRRDLRALRIHRAGPGRLVIGRWGGSLVATEYRHSVLVLGPTQSGKTTGLAIPAILEWTGPVLATSVKDDLAGATIGWRSRQGRCWIFDPTRSSGLAPTAGWSPLAEADHWSGAQRVAAWMVDAAPARGGMPDGAFWFAAAAKLLAPLLLAARRSGGTMADVVRWTNAGEFDEPIDVLESGSEIQAAVALGACAARDERLRSSVGATLETVLTPFEDPIVAAATASIDVDPVALLAGSHTLYLCGPAHEQARVQGLFATLVAAVVAGAVNRANRGEGPLDPPLLMVLDEAANIAPLRDLDTLASTGAGLGIQLVTVCQDLAQLSGRYGSDRSRTIANNHRAKVILSGVSDLSTLDLLSGLAGEQAVRSDTLTSDLRDGRRTRATATTYRRLASTDELRRIGPGDGLLIYGHLPPARLALRPWYRDRLLRNRVSTPR